MSIRGNQVQPKRSLVIEGAMSANNFFVAESFAVAGASSNPSKYGYKVLSWYRNHGLPVTPINPKADLIQSLTPVSKLAELKDPKSVSVSVITPPSVTMDLLKEAAKLGIPSLWLQPGSFDGEVMAAAKELEGKINIIAQGRCILVEGDQALAIARQHGGARI